VDAVNRRIVRVVGAVGLSAAVALCNAAAMGGSPLDGIKNGLSRIGSAFSPSDSAPTPNTPPEKDAVSLQTPATPGAELYVAIARLHEQAGRLPEAETHYRAALERAPNDLPALLGYARLKSVLGQHDAAVELDLAVQRLQDNHPGVASDHAQRARAIENRVENVYREALAELFRDPHDLDDVVRMLKLREVYRHLSNAADRGVEASNVITDIVVKMT
jgi:tetratricopeptide (TPR) repeat protein